MGHHGYPNDEISKIKEPMDTIFVKGGSSAQHSGLKKGDRVVSVNGEFIAGKSYAEVVQLIQSTKDHLQLSVVPQQDDILQMYFAEIAQNPESNQSSINNTPITSQTRQQHNVWSSDSNIESDKDNNFQNKNSGSSRRLDNSRSPHPNQ